MKRETTQNSYVARLERVSRWLAEHLDDTIDLARLADVACMSPYHLHRVYHAMHGETAADTVRRHRLHRAAGELIAGDLPVVRIARRAGYRSQEAFTRAFRSAYGVPPARYRASLVTNPATSEAEGRRDTLKQYEVIVRDLPKIRVAVLAHRGDYMGIGTTFERLLIMLAGHGLVGEDTRSFGIYYDDPSATDPGSLRADACISVPEDWQPGDEDLKARDIRGGRYAVTTHIGPYSELERAYQWLYGSWLPDSGEEPDDAPCIEAYLNDPRRVPPTELETEVRLPLR